MPGTPVGGSRNCSFSVSLQLLAPPSSMGSAATMGSAYEPMPAVHKPTRVPHDGSLKNSLAGGEGAAAGSLDGSRRHERHREVSQDV